MWIVVTACVAIVLFYLVKNCRRPDGYPPGPLFLPLIGTWYCMPPVCAARHVAAWRKKYGKIIGHRIGFRNVVIVTGYEEIVAGLKHPNLQNRLSTEFQKGRSFNQKLGFFFADGEQWAKVRAMTFRFFGQVYNTLPKLLQREMNEFFGTIKSGSITEINSKFMRMPLNITCLWMVGTMRDNFKPEIEKIAELTNKAFIENRVTSIEVFHPAMKIFSKYKSLFEASVYTHNNFFKICIDEHKKTFDPSCIRDYIDAYLAEAEKEKESGTKFFTDLELSACMLDMIQAGNESTGNTFNFILLYVALNPRTQDEMHKEIDRVIGKKGVPELTDKPSLQYCQAVIQEAMRINPISPLGVSHIAAVDFEFYGYKIPQDTAVFFAHDDMMNDPEYWDEPEKFKPERFLDCETKAKLTNFGLGKRSCLGEILVKNILFLLTVGFFQKYKIQLPEGFENPTTEPRRGITNSVYPFKLIITERQ